MTREQMKIGGWMALGSALTLIAAGSMQHAQAQQGGGFGGQGGGFGGQGGGQGGFPGGPGGGQGGFPGGPGGMMGMRGGPGGASLTATEKYVYILRGDMLYQYAVEGLKLTAKAQLPRDQQQGGPGGGGFPPGGGGGFGGPPPAPESNEKTK